MPRVDQQSGTERSGRLSASRAHSGLRLSPRLESLETRCLLSGWGTADEPTEFLSGRTHAAAENGSNSVSVGEDTRRSEYSAEDLRYSLGSSFSLSSLPAGSYTVLTESPGPHDSPASAQPLPDLHFFGVIGAIGTGGSIDYYRLSLGPTTSTLVLGLTSRFDSLGVPLQLQVFDGSGRDLAEWSTGPEAQGPFHLDLGQLSAGSTIYLGVSAAGSQGSAGSAGAVDYQLWIGLPTANSAQAVARGASPVSPSAVSPIFALAPAVTPGIAAPTSPGSVASETSTVSATTGSSLAIPGSPEIRPARPAGGLLSTDESTSHAAGESGSLIPRPWADQSPGVTSNDLPDRPAAGPSATIGTGDESLAVLRGPGGFSLLGAVAIGPRHRMPRGTGVIAAARQPLLSLEPRIVEQFEPTSDCSPVEIQAPAEGQDSGGGSRRWPGLPYSAFSSLGLATVMTLNAVLSQPLAGFDYLTSRFDLHRARVQDRRRKTPR
jgi:hypothetical protein